MKADVWDLGLALPNVFYAATLHPDHLLSSRERSPKYPP